KLAKAHALAEVAESFAGGAVFLVLLQDRRQRGHDLVPVDQVLELEVEPMAQRMAADEEGELVAAAADDADVALVWPDAAVRAARHPDADRLVSQSEPLQLVLKFVQNSGQRAFGFGDGEAARWDGRASHAVLAHVGGL